MHVALQGALWGLAIGVILIMVEYNFVKKAVQERAEMQHRKPEFEEVDRKRIRQVANFSIFIPPAFALGAWLIWG
jgi:hypothetical protein